MVLRRSIAINQGQARKMEPTGDMVHTTVALRDTESESEPAASLESLIDEVQSDGKSDS
jgi:hypothetical protein